LAVAVKDQIDDLKRSSYGVNDREKLDEFVDFLKKLAAGLNDLADALDRMVDAKAKGSNEKFFTEDAARIARELGAYVTKFAEDHPYITDTVIKVSLAAAAYKFFILCGLDTTSIAGVLTAILAKSPSMKNKQ
jgi:hypothetical protein